VQADDTPFITITSPNKHDIFQPSENIVITGKTLPSMDIEVLIYNYHGFDTEQKFFLKSDENGNYEYDF